MSICTRTAVFLVVVLLPFGVAQGTPSDGRGVAGLPAPAGAEGQAKPDAQAGSAAATDAPGKEILQRRCFQCHAASMWTSLKQDRRAWEAVLYRMVGRGALWTEAEITAMADFLAQTRGPGK